MIERVYVVDLGGKLLDESCARKIKSLKPIESYLYNREPTLRFFPMAFSNVRGFRPDEVPMLRLLRQDPSVQSSSFNLHIFKHVSIYHCASVLCLGMIPCYPDCDPTSSPDLYHYHISSTTPQYQRSLMSPGPPRHSVMVVDVQNDARILLSPSH